MRSDPTGDRFRASTPASARSWPRCAASCSSARDCFAVRRTSPISARAAASFSRLLSKIAFREFARLRSSTSCQRSSSQRPSAAAARASAASARIRSRSHRDFQVTEAQHDDCGASPVAALPRHRRHPRRALSPRVRAGVAATVILPAGNDFNDDLVALGPATLRARFAPLFRTPACASPAGAGSRSGGGRGERRVGQADPKSGGSP